MHYPFNNQVAVITGGTSGIGKALAIAFLRAGAKVAVCGRNQATLNALQEEVSKLNISNTSKTTLVANTTNKNVQGTNTLNANTLELNTTGTNTASTNIPGTNTLTSSTLEANTTGTNVASTNTNIPDTNALTSNTPEPNTTGTNTASTNIPGTNTRPSNTLEPNTTGTNTASTNIPGTNTLTANTPEPNTTGTNIPGANTSLLTFPADVSSEQDCAAFISATLQHFGQIDILINNAGMSMRALFKDADLKVLKTLMDINFWGTVYCTKFALPHILKTKGTIVGISSIAGYRGLPARTGYSSSKFAMQGFLESLRTENLHTGVNVMWVSPGFTASNIRNTSLNQDGQAQGDTPLDEGKLMTAEEVANRTLKAIAKRKRQVVFTAQGKLTVLLNHLIPGIVDKLVYNVFRKEPNSPLK